MEWYIRSKPSGFGPSRNQTNRPNHEKRYQSRKWTKETRFTRNRKTVSFIESRATWPLLYNPGKQIQNCFRNFSFPGHEPDLITGKLTHFFSNFQFRGRDTTRELDRYWKTRPCEFPQDEFSSNTVCTTPWNLWNINFRLNAFIWMSFPVKWPVSGSKNEISKRIGWVFPVKRSGLSWAAHDPENWNIGKISGWVFQDLLITTFPATKF